MIGVEVFEINCVVKRAGAVCRNRAVGVLVFLNFGTLNLLPWRRCLALPFVQMGRSEIVVTMRDLPEIVHYERSSPLIPAQVRHYVFGGGSCVSNVHLRVCRATDWGC